MAQSVKDTARKLDIHTVYISASSCMFLNDFDPLLPSQMLTGQYAINTVSISRKNLINEIEKIQARYIRFHVQASMRYMKGEPTDEQMKNEEWVKESTASEINAVYCVEYAIKPDIELTEEEIGAFANVNVPYHVWPFWREYCQNTCNRMNLPVSMVPMLIIDQKQKTEEAK